MYKKGVFATADMILLNEHGITNRNKVNIEGYITFSKNRTKKTMGGVSISTKKAEAHHIAKLKKEKMMGNLLWLDVKSINLQLM